MATRKTFYVIYESQYQVDTGYYLSQDDAVEFAKVRSSKMSKECPGTWNYVVVRELPFDTHMTKENVWNAPIVWDSTQSNAAQNE